MKAKIFNIQRMSLHDGPGIRTTVFFKKCNLKCIWCHNPESLNEKAEIQWIPQQCICCGKCIAACQAQARSMRQGILVYAKEKCKNCGKCAERCPTDAIKLIGYEMDTARIAAEVEKDQLMYKISQGGVTCSGGEPLMQADAVADLLCRLKKTGIHTAVDTAGNVKYDAFEKVIPYTDLFLYDLKHWDSEAHRHYTGVSNELIIENFNKLEKQNNIIVRVPMIQGIQETAIESIAKFLKGKSNVKLVELLPYHGLGESKYRTLGKEEKPLLKAPIEAVLLEAANHFKTRDIPVRISG